MIRRTGARLTLDDRQRAREAEEKLEQLSRRATELEETLAAAQKRAKDERSRLRKLRREHLRDLFMARNLVSAGATSAELGDRLDDLIHRRRRGTHARDD